MPLLAYTCWCQVGLTVDPFLIYRRCHMDQTGTCVDCSSFPWPGTHIYTWSISHVYTCSWNRGLINILEGAMWTGIQAPPKQQQQQLMSISCQATQRLLELCSSFLNIRYIYIQIVVLIFLDWMHGWPAAHTKHTDPLLLFSVAAWNTCASIFFLV